MARPMYRKSRKDSIVKARATQFHVVTCGACRNFQTIMPQPDHLTKCPFEDNHRKCPYFRSRTKLPSISGFRRRGRQHKIAE